MDQSEQLRKRREAIIQAHIDGETHMDADEVLATLADDATYELVGINRTLKGHDEIRAFLGILFAAAPGIVHRAARIFHTETNVIVETETDFPNGFDGKTPGKIEVMRAVSIFPFDGERSLGERLYSDMSAVVPYLDRVG